MSFRTTASQTVGPYLHIGLTWLVTDNLVGPDVTGDPVTIDGRITDAEGTPVDDALVEIWQANARGRYDHPDDTRNIPLEPGFRGFGRVPTNAAGAFRITTIKPGRVPVPGGALQAPHLSVMIFARGLLKHLSTRMYFPDEAANAEDPILRLVPQERRATLIAQRDAHGLSWNVVMQGLDETVFFDF